MDTYSKKVSSKNLICKQNIFSLVKEQKNERTLRCGVAKNIQ